MEENLIEYLNIPEMLMVKLLKLRDMFAVIGLTVVEKTSSKFI